MTKEQIGKRIAELRNREGISQLGLAKAIDVTRAAVNAWEIGASSPSARALIDLAAYFHVSLDYLVGRETEEVISLEGLTEKDKQFVIEMIHRLESTPE